MMKDNILLIDLGKQYGGVEKSIESIIKYSKYKFAIVVRKDSKLNSVIKEKYKMKLNDIAEVDVSVNHIIRSIIQIRKFMKKNNIKIIHTHGITSTLFGMISKKRYMKNIVTVHGYANLDRIERPKIEQEIFLLIEKIELKKAELCIAVSTDIRRYIKKVTNGDVVVINNGIHTDEYILDSQKPYGKIIRIGSVGRLEKIKGYDNLIRALGICRNKGFSNFYCEIAGEGAEKDYLQRLINSLKLNQQCKLIGFVNNVNDFYKELDIYIQPSIIEAFGISLIEAMAIGLPVIATNSGGIVDIIDNMENGIMFEKQNYKDLADKIIYLCSHIDKKNYISRNAIKKVINNFKIEDKINELDRVYEEVSNK